MPVRLRLLAAVVAVAAALVGASMAPAGGATTDPQAQRDAARAKKTQLARELNALSATEDQLEDAAKALDDDVKAVTAQVEGARQAAAVADAELTRAQAAVDATETRVEYMTRLLVGRAVARFMAPDALGPDLVSTDDLAESARKQTLLDTVASKDRDLLDQLGAAKEDLMAQQRAVQAANARTIERKQQTEDRLAALQRSRADKERAAAAVEQRRQDVLKEIDAAAKSEAELTKIINARSGAVVGDSGATSSGCIWPVRGVVTSEFGTRWGRLHAGIDIGAPVGTAVWASKSGQVIFVGQQGGYGNVIIVAHGNGLTTLYGHLSRIGVSEGLQVRQGQVIGASGNSGQSTGPHLHFETRISGSPRNPRSCLG
jgi:murein DD-endopeptidase MepM/ murein hydrolase activator NlpD